MEKIDLLLNVMTLTMKINNLDSTITEEISILSGESIDADVRAALDSLEENLIQKISKDPASISFIRDHFSNSSILDADYVVDSAYIHGLNGIEKDVFIQVLSSNKTFSSIEKTYKYYYSLSNAAIASADNEIIEMTINKLSAIQSGV